MVEKWKKFRSRFVQCSECTKPSQTEKKLLSLATIGYSKVRIHSRSVVVTRFAVPRHVLLSKDTGRWCFRHHHHASHSIRHQSYDVETAQQVWSLEATSVAIAPTFLDALNRLPNRLKQGGATENGILWPYRAKSPLNEWGRQKALGRRHCDNYVMLKYAILLYIHLLNVVISVTNIRRCLRKRLDSVTRCTTNLLSPRKFPQRKNWRTRLRPTQHKFSNTP